jgi:phytoene/squalene synthetase
MDISRRRGYEAVREFPTSNEAKRDHYGLLFTEVEDYGRYYHYGAGTVGFMATMLLLRPILARVMAPIEH